MVGLSKDKKKNKKNKEPNWDKTTVLTSVQVSSFKKFKWYGSFAR